MEIAGYRVLRTLSRGPTTKLHLGYAPDSNPQVVVIRVPIDAGDPRTERVLAAHSLSRHPHVARLVDIGVDERGAACALFERLPDDLPGLLLGRDAFTGGESVTLLAPIVMAIGALHDAGIAHGSLSAGSIRFRGDGAPVLVGFGAAAFFAPDAPEVMRERVAEVVRDREALRALSIAILERVGDAGTPELAERIRVAPHHRVGSEVIDVLHALGRPAPIGIADPVPVAPSRASIADDDLGEPVGRDRTDDQVVPPDRWPRVVTIARRIATPLMRAGPAAALRDSILRRWHSFSGRTRRLGLAGVIAVTVMVIALSAIPSSPRTAGPVMVAPSGAPRLGSASPGATDPALVGPDPVAAARVLVRERDRCIQLAARSCLDAIDQPDSPAAESDRALIADLVDGAEPPTPPSLGELRLAQQWGDTALVSLGPNADPTSLLVMKGEAGWRIRSYEPRA